MKRQVPWILLLAALGPIQLPFQMAGHVLFQTAQGELVEELLFGFLSGIVVWALCAGVSLLLCKRFPQQRGKHFAVLLSVLGLILFAIMTVLFLGTVFYDS